MHNNLTSLNVHNCFLLLFVSHDSIWMVEFEKFQFNYCPYEMCSVHDEGCIHLICIDTCDNNTWTLPKIFVIFTSLSFIQQFTFCTLLSAVYQTHVFYTIFDNLCFYTAFVLTQINSSYNFQGYRLGLLQLLLFTVGACPGL